MPIQKKGRELVICFVPRSVFRILLEVLIMSYFFINSLQFIASYLIKSNPILYYLTLSYLILPSCSPAWHNGEDLSYNLFLFIVGFFTPLTIIIVTSCLVLAHVNVVGSLTLSLILFLIFSLVLFLTLSSYHILHPPHHHHCHLLPRSCPR